jgi:hypothetical protein
MDSSRLARDLPSFVDFDRGAAESFSGRFLFRCEAGRVKKDDMFGVVKRGEGGSQEVKLSEGRKSSWEVRVP